MTLGRQIQRKPFWSARRVVLTITVASGGTALAAGTTTWVVETADYSHPLGQVGWLAFPAGFVAACGLFFVIGDAVLEAPSIGKEQQAPGSPQGGFHQSVGAVAWTMHTYAICMLMGALACIVLAISSRNLLSFGTSVFLLACIGAFYWSAWRTSWTTRSSRPGTSAGNEWVRTSVRWSPDPSSRQLGLIFTGSGGGIAVSTLLITLFSVHVQDGGRPYGALLFLIPSLFLSSVGLAAFLEDSLDRFAQRH